MKIRAALAPALATAVVLGGAAVVPAEALTVHNFFYCSNQTGKCRQTNGPYNKAYPTACQWTYSTYWTGTSTAICDYWKR